MIFILRFWASLEATDIDGDLVAVWYEHGVHCHMGGGVDDEGKGRVVEVLGRAKG